jgi:hypothetical protein
MPEPNRTPWLIDPDLAGTPMARLIDTGAVVRLVCHACRHPARWDAGELRRRFAGRATLTFRGLAPRLRCGRCRSEWVEVFKEATASR